MSEFCNVCGAPLRKLDIAATMKFINRGATEYLCIPCIAAHYKVPESRIYELIERYRQQGCALFQ